LADFVLVHGAWGGGWAYERLARELHEHGHRVVVAQLTGLGTRQGELHPGIVLSDHIDDVVAQVEAAGFERFVLCGHSYGGMIITGVATRLGAQIDALVYIDAFLPGDGESLWDITGNREHCHYIDSQKHCPGLVAPLFEAPPGRLSPHPLLTLLEAVRFTGEEAKVPRRTYIFATDWKLSPFERFLEKVRGDSAWEVHLAKCGHDVMAGQPEQLLRIVLDCA
jgi:pimeloyl-ACP methyl ester carboxylesterase